MDRQKIKLIAVAIEDIEELETLIEDMKRSAKWSIPEKLQKDEEIHKTIIKAFEKKLEKEIKELDAFMKEGTDA